jgi:hypothetical protein
MNEWKRKEKKTRLGGEVFERCEVRRVDVCRA